jgi:hypothetical protein
MSRNFHQGIATLTITISHLLSRLESMNQDRHHQVRDDISKRISKERSCSWNEVGEITAAIEMLDISMHEEVQLRASVTSRIIKHLSYTAMTDRYENIVEAHPLTFEWAFHNPTEDQLPWSNLSKWLKTGRGVYWVGGKAGSGKSTLMKHIFDSGRTREYLKAWAGHTPLCLASFFFWNSGLAVQKSQVGCLRALLFQILSKYPDLIPLVLPELWTALYSQSVREGGIGYNFSTIWPLKQLMGTFKVIVRQKSIPLKICFLIDGLDEFDGDHDEMATLFKEITDSGDVKVCLSSRPWVVFEDLFGACEGLRLQNLTYRDIEKYVGDRLGRNNAFQRLASRNPAYAESLKLEVVGKAEGVFLWVKLVVQSLLNGIRNRDSLLDLRDRLRLLPRELEPLYQRLLDLIEPIYLPWASKAFQIVRANHILTNLTADISDWRCSAASPLTLRGFCLAMNTEGNIETIRKWTFSRLPIEITYYDDMVVQLTARCAGLLEVTNARGYPPWEGNAAVQYFHRTARDFLETDVIWSRLLLQTAGTDFEPNIAMMRSSLMCLRMGIPSELTRDFLVYAVHAYHVDTNTTKHRALYALIDQFENLRSESPIALCPGRDNPWMPHWAVTANNTATFFELTTLYGLWWYVENKLSQLSIAFRRESATRLLGYASAMWSLPILEMVSVLLDLGASPKVQHDAWVNTLRYATTVSATDISTKYEMGGSIVGIASPKMLTQRYIAIMKLLVRKGADPYAHIPNVPEDALGIVEKFLIPHYPLESAELLDEIHKSRAAAQNKRATKHQNEDAGEDGTGKSKKYKLLHR